MGFGLRINFSKSGIGYSWGTKGYRVTQTAKGTVRTTYSIPGTGISYVEESKKHQRNYNNCYPKSDNYYNTQEIQNNVTNSDYSNDIDEMLRAANTALEIQTTLGFIIDAMVTLTVISIIAATVCNGLSLWSSDMNPIVILVFTCSAYLFMPALTAILILLKVIRRERDRVNLTYEIGQECGDIVHRKLRLIMNMIQCDKIWFIKETSSVYNNKYTAGADNVVRRVPCKISTVMPFPFKSNMSVVSFVCCGETLIFLPDKLLIIKGQKVNALNYSDIEFKFKQSKFRDNEAIPNDAIVVGSTWQYVNKDGGPDKRFSYNKRIPICLYGELYLTSNYGLNTVIMFSNLNKITQSSNAYAGKKYQPVNLYTVRQ